MGDKRRRDLFDVQPGHSFSEEQAALLGRKPSGQGGLGSVALVAEHKQLEEPGRGLFIVTEDDIADHQVVRHGQFIIDSAVPNGLAFNVVDPSGVRWEGGGVSLGRCWEALATFLAGDEPYLEMVSPIDGTRNRLLRQAAERVLVLQEAKSIIKKSAPVSRPGGKVPLFGLDGQPLRG